MGHLMLIRSDCAGDRERQQRATNHRELASKKRGRWRRSRTCAFIHCADSKEKSPPPSPTSQSPAGSKSLKRGWEPVRGRRRGGVPRLMISFRLVVLNFELGVRNLWEGIGDWGERYLPTSFLRRVRNLCKGVGNSTSVGMGAMEGLRFL